MVQIELPTRMRGKGRTYTICLPSGDQWGLFPSPSSRSTFPLSSTIASLLVTPFMIAIAISLPSGDHSGKHAPVDRWVSLWSPFPFAFTMWI